MKFGAKSPAAVMELFTKYNDPQHVRMHLDHVPVIDEDGRRVDAEAVLAEAIGLGYGSVMIDGSRLGLEENIAATARAARLAHAAGIPIEAELGAVLGHEAGPLPPYEELFASGKGFTDPAEAGRFVAETGADWLSVAVGNIHGAISEAGRGKKKVEARLNIAHLDRIRQAAGVPLVLHGGSGIRREFLLQAFRHGIAKINIGTALRQAYEPLATKDLEEARLAVYDAAVHLVKDELATGGAAELVNPA